MTYKLNPWVNLIVSPVVVRIGTQMQELPNGTAAAEMVFEKSVVITAVEACDGKVVLRVEKNRKVNDSEWSDGDEVSYFE